MRIERGYSVAWGLTCTSDTFGRLHCSYSVLIFPSLHSCRKIYNSRFSNQNSVISVSQFPLVGSQTIVLSKKLSRASSIVIMSALTWSGRWDHLNKLLMRTSVAHGVFEATDEPLAVVQEYCKLLVVGAGGLGCELLKNLCLMGFVDVHVIDMDTIDLSNLNRQFLFRQNDIGRPKAEVAADFVNKRIPGARVAPHYKKIQDYDEDFYREFDIVVCGLDSVMARRWMNSMLVSIALDPENPKLIPLIDGGTEGFKGNVKIVLPGRSACVECTLNLYPPQVSFPMCTIAQTPRLPEHCIEYVRLMQWPEESPYGKEIDGDNPDHIQWIYQKAVERGAQYGISNITYRLTQGVIKNIIPAVASTNAVIAAACATEVFKLVSGCAPSLNNYMVFNDTDGIYAYTYEQEKKEDCMVCSCVPQALHFGEEDTLEDVVNYLINSSTYQMRNPSITMVTPEGKPRTLYIQTVEALRKATEPNLKKSLRDLNIHSGTQLAISDVTVMSSQMFAVHFDENQMEF